VRVAVVAATNAHLAGIGLLAVHRPDRQFRVPAAMPVELVAHARDQQFVSTGSLPMATVHS
jgi:hypothetical protein